MRSFVSATLCVAACAAVLAGSLATAGQPAKQTATQFYMAYRAAFDKATKIDDILPLMCAETRKQIEATPAGDREQMFGMIKMMDTHTKIKVQREDRQGDGSVVLSVTAYDTEQKKDVSAKVTVAKEGEDWKLVKESWTSGS